MGKARPKMRYVLRKAKRADEMKGEPGGESGLMSLKVKQIGTGREVPQFEEGHFDAWLCQEIRETLKHIAIKMGEWMERRDAAGDDKHRKVI
jgi:hypothetical protein